MLTCSNTPRCLSMSSKKSSAAKSSSPSSLDTNPRAYLVVSQMMESSLDLPLVER